jgi:hypothetical protein
LASQRADGSVARRELNRLTRENARLVKQLTQTEAALAIMGKLALPEMECMGGQPVPLDWVVSVS